MTDENTAGEYGNDNRRHFCTNFVAVGKTYSALTGMESAKRVSAATSSCNIGVREEFELPWNLSEAIRSVTEMMLLGRAGSKDTSDDYNAVADNNVI